MAELSPDKVVVGAIGAAIGAAISTLLPGGLTSAIGVLITSAGSIVGLIFSLMYKRYLGVLAASAHDKKSIDPNARAERQAYDELRKSLRGGNIAARLYADWLTKFLDAVDRFFGDADKAHRTSVDRFFGYADKAHQTLFPRAFGLKTPAPLWTAAAFDRCLLLALIYPIATIFIIWAVSGHVGPAEAALGLKPDIAGWRRGIAVGAMIILALAILGAGRRSRGQVGFAFAVAGAVGFAFAVAVAVTDVAAFAIAGSVAIAAAVALVIARAVGWGSALAIAVAFAVAVAIGIAGAIAIAGAVSRRPRGPFSGNAPVLGVAPC